MPRRAKAQTPSCLCAVPHVIPRQNLVEPSEPSRTRSFARDSTVLQEPHSNISWIISFLKPAFHDTDYEKVERMLNLRDEKLILVKNALEVELKKKAQELVELRNNVVETDVELEISRTKCQRGSKAKEMIAALSEELKRTEMCKKERYADLEKENQELVLVKSRGQVDDEAQKKGYREMAARVYQLG
ncbi:hypothetical protein Syun_019327 [Stephania yunnanensis]|uniref:Uncharacterized protein n=1 Tax=Stephania yunnanensis TaxID=152371 RepID=A0AAP0IV47_9MAGN